jgi:hypothetical protein
VTRSAVIQDTLVIKRGLGKRCGGMAHRTILGDRNMGWVNLGIGSGRDDAIVTRRTVVDTAGLKLPPAAWQTPQSSVVKTWPASIPCAVPVPSAT